MGMGGNDSFVHLKANCPADKINLLTRKDVYPYSFVDSSVRFDDLLQEATIRPLIATPS